MYEQEYDRASSRYLSEQVGYVTFLLSPYWEISDGQTRGHADVRSGSRDRGICEGSNPHLYQYCRRVACNPGTGVAPPNPIAQPDDAAGFPHRGGRRYLAHCEQILAHVDLADAEAAGSGIEASGKLRVHASTSFGQHYLTPLIVDYTQQFPDVSVQLVLAQRMPDLLEENFDVCIVVSPGLKDSALISQLIGSTRSVLCASPRYLAEHGTPASVTNLAQHDCLALTMQDNTFIPWLFDGPEEYVFRPSRVAPFTVNVAETLAEAIRAGMGIGLLPVSTALQGIMEGTLVHVLPQSPLRPNNVYALYASRQYIDAKIRTFVGFLREAAPRRLSRLEETLRNCSA